MASEKKGKQSAPDVSIQYPIGSFSDSRLARKASACPLRPDIRHSRLATSVYEWLCEVDYLSGPGRNSLIHVKTDRLRPKRTATLPRSGFILRSPARVSRKREFSWIRLETFGSSRPKKFERWSLETIGDEKSPHLAGLSHQEKKILRKQECLAALGGIEPGHSQMSNGL